MIVNIQPRHHATRITATIGAFLTWTAVFLQFMIVLQNPTISIQETVVRFFSYYTILTNILVALCFTASLIKGVSNRQSFFTNPSVLGATAVYITIVGGIYNLVLRALWTPTGLQLWVDELLHTVIPLLYLAFWFFLSVKANLHWRNVFIWLVYPLGYFMILLIRGAASGFYPYPFINVLELGLPQVIVNSAFITGAFIALSLLIILISRALHRRHFLTSESV